MMSWASRELAIAHGTHFAAQGLLAHRDAEVFPNPLSQITQTPANYAIQMRSRSALYGLRQSRSLFIVQERRLARGLAVDQAVGTAFIEAQKVSGRTVSTPLSRTTTGAVMIALSTARAAILESMTRSPRFDVSWGASSLPATMLSAGMANCRRPSTAAKRAYPIKVQEVRPARKVPKSQRKEISLRSRRSLRSAKIGRSFPSERLIERVSFNPCRSVCDKRHSNGFAAP